MTEKPIADQPPLESSSLTIKQKVGDAANKWLERNRNLVLRQTPVWAQSLACILAALGTITIVGSFIFRIDEVVTLQGQLVSIGGTVEVKTPAGGRVSEVFYKDGQLVRQGDLLMKFDTREATEEKDTLTSLILLEKQKLESQVLTFSSQEKMLLGRMDVMKKKLQTKTTITKELANLVQAGGFQKLQYLEQLDTVYELQKQLSELNEQLSQLEFAAQQTTYQSTKSIKEMSNRIRQTELQLQYKNVNAPVTGVVFDPQASPEGVLNAGERILSIVPQEGLFAEVFVPNKDIGFVEAGQAAKIRVDAFPFTRYGELRGTVVQIGADALPPTPEMSFYRFPVKLNLIKSYLESQGRKIFLKSGMAITTNLKLRDKRIIGLVSDLLVDQADSVKSLRQQ